MFREVDLRIPNPQRSQEGDRTDALLATILTMDQTKPDYMEKIHELFISGFGQGSKIRLPFYCNLAKNIQVGQNVSIMPYFKCMSAGKVIIEDDVQIALDVKIITNNHDFYQRKILTVDDVHIKKGAWIGAGSIILPGITIGKYAIVGAGSVVTHDVPDYVVVAGNPARVIRTLDSNRFME